MKGYEKILAVIMAIMVVIIVVLGIQKTNADIEIGALEYQENELRESRIAIHDNQIDALNKIISTLQIENDSLRNEKKKIYTVTIHEIDSIRALPFVGKRVFFINQIHKLDSTYRTSFTRLETSKKP